MDTTVEQTGITLVDFKLLKILEKTQAETLSLSIKENRLVIDYELGSFFVPIYDLKDYPDIEFKHGNQPVGELFSNYKKVIFAIKPVNPLNNGLTCINFSNNLIIGADGECVFIAQGSNLDCLIPAKLAKVLSIIQFNFYWTKDNNKLYFNSEIQALIITLSEDVYPNMDVVLKKLNSEMFFQTDFNQLKNSIIWALSFTDTDEKFVDIIITANSIEILGRDADYCKGSTSLPAFVSGKEATFTISGKFVDGLNGMTTNVICYYDIDKHLIWLKDDNENIFLIAAIQKG